MMASQLVLPKAIQIVPVQHLGQPKAILTALDFPKDWKKVIRIVAALDWGQQKVTRKDLRWVPRCLQNLAQ